MKLISYRLFSAWDGIMGETASAKRHHICSANLTIYKIKKEEEVYSFVYFESAVFGRFKK
jgi:hypothetical protein